MPRRFISSPRLAMTSKGVLPDLRRLKNPADGLVEDVGGHGPQDHAVDQGHQDFQAVVSRRSFGPWGCARPTQGQQLRPRAATSLTCGRESASRAKAVAENAATNSHHEKSRLGPEGQAQAGLACFWKCWWWYMVVAVIHTLSIRMARSDKA